MTRILGIALLRDENRFAAWSLLNAADFCDRLLVLDNGSTDGTRAIVERARALRPVIEIADAPDAYDTHRFVEPFAGQDWWVLGVDGDEIYDRARLARLRPRILSGEFDRWWKIHGHSLHATGFDFAAGRATGHLPPAARSITKLYNFRAIESWRQGRHQRLHGKDMAFRPGWSADSLLETWAEHGWDEAPLRCLHLCFYPRSSLGSAPARPNPSEIRKTRRPLDRLRAALFGGAPSRPNYKRLNYAQGPTATVALDGFGAPEDWIAADPLAAEARALLERGAGPAAAA